jgi:hypothetical protein
MWECVCFIFMYYTIDYKIINYYFLFLFLVCVYIMHILCILCILYVLYMLYVWCKCLYWLSPCLYRSFQHYLEGQYNWEPPLRKAQKKNAYQGVISCWKLHFRKIWCFHPFRSKYKVSEDVDTWWSSDGLWVPSGITPSVSHWIPGYAGSRANPSAY